MQNRHLTAPKPKGLGFVAEDLINACPICLGEWINEKDIFTQKYVGNSNNCWNHIHHFRN